MKNKSFKTVYCSGHKKIEAAQSDGSVDSYTASVRMAIHLEDEEKIEDLKNVMKTSRTFNMNADRFYCKLSETS
jgi:hypothetical protein